MRKPREENEGEDKGKRRRKRQKWVKGEIKEEK